MCFQTRFRLIFLKDICQEVFKISAKINYQPGYQYIIYKDEQNYTIQTEVVNNGNAVYYPEMKIYLPNITEYISFRSKDASCNPDGGIISCTIGHIMLTKASAEVEVYFKTNLIDKSEENVTINIEVGSGAIYEQTRNITNEKTFIAEIRPKAKVQIKG